MPAAVNDSVRLSVFLSNARSAKFATPATVWTLVVPCSEPPTPPSPTTATVTTSTLSVRVLPPRSCTATTGGVANGAPPVEPAGCVVRPSLVAFPTATLTVCVTLAIPSTVVKVMFWEPALSSVSERPVKSAVPAMHATFVVPERVPVPALTAVTVTTLSDRTFPPRSCTATTGCVVNGTPPTAPAAFRVTVSFAGGPTDTSSPGCVVFAVMPPVEKVRVMSSALVYVSLAKVATPATAVATTLDRTPLPEVTYAVTGVSLAVTVLPPMSWIATTGCVVNGSPPNAISADLVTVNLTGGPTVTMMSVCWTLVIPTAVKVSVSLLLEALSYTRRENTASPLAAVTVTPAVRDPVPPLDAAVTTRELSARVCPSASWIATTGGCAKGEPPVAPCPGVTTPSLVAAPTTTSLCVTERTSVAENVSVMFSALSYLRPRLE
mmetsp:Transcript_22030/g.51651  ORF Transcript_22030/g.51651 Transcript_22030/m.51651 type:complete len:436 (-) Transcript_22030:2847-4154(-)